MFPDIRTPVKVIRMQQQIQRQGVLYALGAYTLGPGTHLLQVPLRRAGRRDPDPPHDLVLRPADGAGAARTPVAQGAAVLRQPKVLLTLAFTSVTVGGNWLLFIWAINNGHMLDASLGYYINPCSTCCSAWCF